MHRLPRQFWGNSNLLKPSRILLISLSSILLLLIVVYTPLWAQETSVLNKLEYRTDEGLISNNVFSVVFVDSSNSVWFGTDRGVSRYDGTWTSFSGNSDTVESAQFPLGEVKVLEYTKADDSLWAATSLGYVAQWSETEQRWDILLEPDDVSSPSSFYALFAEGSTVWIGTDTGLLIYDVSTASSTSASLSDLVCDESLSIQADTDEPNAVYAIARNNDTLWFGTGSGLFFQNGDSCWRQEKTKIADSTNPPIDSLLWLDQTADGKDNPTLWIGTEGAYAQFNPDAASDERWDVSYVVDDRNDDNPKPVPVKTLSAGTADDIWVATDGKGAINFSATEGTIDYNISIPKRRLNDTVRDIAFDSDGAIWFATPIGATQYLRSDLWSTYDFSVSRLTLPISPTTNISDTSSVVASTTQLMFDALKPNIDDIRDLLVTNTNDLLWIASGGGIRFRGAGNKRGDNYLEELFLGERYVEAQGQEFRNAVLPENPTTALAQDSSGLIWAGFNEKGIAAYQGNRVGDIVGDTVGETIASSDTGMWVIPSWVDQLPSQQINDLLVVDNRLWIGSARADFEFIFL